MASFTRVLHNSRFLSREQSKRLKYWNKKQISDLNDYCYSVLTIIPNVVWNRLSTVYFENLEDAIEYRLRMIEKGIYAQIRDSVK